MKTKDALDHYGSKRAIAKALDISVQAVHKWGKLVPELSAYKLERITNGELEVGDDYL